MDYRVYGDATPHGMKIDFDLDDFYQNLNDFYKLVVLAKRHINIFFTNTTNFNAAIVCEQTLAQMIDKIKTFVNQAHPESGITLLSIFKQFAKELDVD